VDKGYLADTICLNFQQFLTTGFYENEAAMGEQGRPSHGKRTG